ncbi:MAG: cysteine--tRNA ligase [Bacteroidales bacterium]|nr:cysteine--tRNA ligase [Bacteroidales bacterium]MCF8334732.1 cysteine--tRNA ligase [Bacteroidales bacterium]
MDSKLYIHNSLTRKKEAFKPLNSPQAGMYVCGPTVYGDAHLGHARPAITFDLVFRYLLHLGYKVRYVRNITDVGHLEDDADEGEDKIGKKARLEKLEPMEIAHFYSDRYHRNMDQMNVKVPSIEPQASGHIIEQIEMVKQIIDAGYGYEVNSSVYFDVQKYQNDTKKYGELSGRVLEELKANTRELEGQDEKKNPFDFAIWKNAAPEHIMRWPSPWGQGFPGWHMECSAMSTKYLGEKFDIHGGGMDLLFPHHESEIAQSVAANGNEPAQYWMHNNMVTINGQKMGKSLGNFITLNKLFNGEHNLLERPYSPMTIRFFMLQAHYRSTIDFSNEALNAAEKGFKRLMKTLDTLEKIQPANESTVSFKELEKKCYEALNDDFNSPVAISQLFEASRIINSLKDGSEKIAKKDLDDLKAFFKSFTVDVLGLEPEEKVKEKNDELLSRVIENILQVRQEAKQNKDFQTADKIRDALKEAGISIKDRKDGADWSVEE